MPGTLQVIRRGFFTNEPSRVFAAAIDDASLAELKCCELEVLEDGQIGGLNGVLLGAAAEAGLRGACLLGEMPHVFAQLPFPRAAIAVLEAFEKLSGIHVDLAELNRQAAAMDDELRTLMQKVQRMQEAAEAGETEAESETPFLPEPQDEGSLSAEDKSRVDELFDQARLVRSNAYELKRELDRLGVFKEYEDRFLDLFKRSE